MHPGPVLVRQPDRLGEGIERAGVQVPGLEADDGRGAGRAAPERARQRGGDDTPLRVDRHLVGEAEPEVAQREVHRRVTVLADDHPQPWPAGEAEGLHIPADLGELGVPRRREAADVGCRGPGGEPDRGLRRQAEQPQQDLARRLLDPGGRGCRRAHAVVLVPAADQPVRAQRCGEHAAHHPAEESPGIDRHQPGLGQRGQLGNDLLRSGRWLSQCCQRPIADLVCARLWRDRPLRQSVQPVEGPGDSDAQRVLVGAVRFGVHVPDSYARVATRSRYSHSIRPVPAPHLSAKETSAWSSSAVRAGSSATLRYAATVGP